MLVDKLTMKLSFSNLCQFIVVFVLSSLNQSNCCSFVEVNHSSNSSDSISLTWNLSPDCLSSNIGSYQVTALHRKFVACTDETNNSVTTFATSKNAITLRNLHPFSKYKIGLVGMGNPVVETSLEVTTPAGVPQFRPKRSDQYNLALVQAIKFYWATPNQDLCRLRNGRPSGFRVELWGEDPWVLSQDGPLSVSKVQEHVPFFYAQKLSPFTRYRLKVFVINADNSYNSEMALEMSERTMPTVPDPPEEVRAEALSQTSVRLRFNPKYPPTGLIWLYTVRIGTNQTDQNGAGQINWKKRIEFAPSSSLCSRSSSGFALQICFLIQDLDPDTTYTFQVQVSNENIDDPSIFSQSAVAKTDAIPTVIPMTTTSAKATTALETKDFNDDTTTTSATSIASQEQSNQPQQEEASLNQTSKIVTIILTLLALIIFVIICFTLVYKIKMKKLKLRYQQSCQPESYNSSQGYPHRKSVSTLEDSGSFFGTSLRSKSISGHIFGPPSLQGVMAGTPGGMTTANFIHSVANQIEEIQSRRLPEPPPTSEMPSLSKTTINEEDEDSKSGAYVQIENDESGTLVTRYHNAADRTDNQTVCPPYIPMEMLVTNRGEAEVTDVYGYLKPTFHQFSTAFSTTTTSADIYSQPIPIESYCNSTPSNSTFTTTTMTSPLTLDCYDAPRSLSRESAGSSTPKTRPESTDAESLIHASIKSSTHKTESVNAKGLEVEKCAKTKPDRAPSPSISSSTASECYDTPRSLTASNSNLSSIKSDFLSLQSVQV